MFNLLAPAVFTVPGFESLPDKERPRIYFERASTNEVEEFHMAIANRSVELQQKRKELLKSGDLASFEDYKSMFLDTNERHLREQHELLKASYDHAEKERLKAENLGERPEPHGIEDPGVFEYEAPSDELLKQHHQNTGMAVAGQMVPGAAKPYLQLCLSKIKRIENFAAGEHTLLWEDLKDFGDGVSRTFLLTRLSTGDDAFAVLQLLTHRILEGIDEEGKPGFKAIVVDDGEQEKEPSTQESPETN